MNKPHTEEVKIYRCPNCKTGYVKETPCGDYRCRDLVPVPVAVLEPTEENRTVEEVVKEFEKVFFDTNDKILGTQLKLAMSEHLKRNLPQAIAQAKEEETVICAAVRSTDGKLIIRGHRHANCLYAPFGLQGHKGYEKDQPHGDNQGFITSKNRYVNREEGQRLQKAASIKSFDKGGYRGKDLYSEDLY